MKKLKVFILGLLSAFVIAEICVRLFLFAYLSLAAPDRFKRNQAEKLYWIYGSCLLEKYVKFDKICGFLPKNGFFRSPIVSVHSKFDLYPYADYYSYNKEKKEDIRIICIGDSTTYGPSYYDSYPYILGELLKNAFPDKDIRVLNAGLSSASSKQLKRIFQFYLIEYKPDVLIWRKGAELTDTYEVSINAFNNVRYQLWRYLYSSRLFRITCIALDMNKHLPIHTSREKVRDFIKQMLSMDSFLHNRRINQSVNISDKFNSDFQIVKKIAFEYGINNVLAVDYLLKKGPVIESDCYDFLKKNLQPIVCTKDSFLKSLADKPGDELFTDACHLTKLGDAIIAQDIFNFLINKRWIEEILAKSKKEYNNSSRFR